jgi:hypothetical protein
MRQAICLFLFTFALLISPVHAQEQHLKVWVEPRPYNQERTLSEAKVLAYPNDIAITLETDSKVVPMQITAVLALYVGKKADDKSDFIILLGDSPNERKTYQGTIQIPGDQFKFVTYDSAGKETSIRETLGRDKVSMLIFVDRTKPLSPTKAQVEPAPRPVVQAPVPVLQPAETPVPNGNASAPLVHRLGILKYEAERLGEEYTYACRKLDELRHPPLPLSSCPPLRDPAEALAQASERVSALRAAYQAHMAEIGHLERALIFLPRPLPQATPEPYEAFPNQPCVKVVPICGRTPFKISEWADKNPYGSLELRIAQTQSPPFQSRFEQPAHFPLPRFAPDGERIDTEGVVIYEGMRFIATRDGQYEVSFTTSVPKMAVTLRLQLLFTAREGYRFTLTLPPIVIAPEGHFKGNYVGQAFQVYHAGYSAMLSHRFVELADVALTRQGTARFGGWPEGINRYETLSAMPVSGQMPGSDSADDGYSYQAGGSEHP